MEMKHDSNWIYIMDDDKNVIAEVTFPNVNEGVVDINHTYVDGSLRGKGIADKLVNAAYDSIKEQEKKALLSCPYAVKWFDEHPEKNDIVKK
jgi:predicted GNAT family acetyltransferase